MLCEDGVDKLLRLWDQLRVNFIVMARLTRPVQSLFRRETRWQATDLDGTEVAELDHREADLPASARVIAIRKARPADAVAIAARMLQELSAASLARETVPAAPADERCAPPGECSGCMTSL